MLLFLIIEKISIKAWKQMNWREWYSHKSLLISVSELLCYANLETTVLAYIDVKWSIKAKWIYMKLFRTKLTSPCLPVVLVWWSQFLLTFSNMFSSRPRDLTMITSSLLFQLVWRYLLLLNYPNEQYWWLKYLLKGSYNIL